MARKKQRPRRQPWWLRRKVRRQLTVLAAVVVAVALLGWVAVYFGGRGNDQETTQQNVFGPASAFTLPTIAGDEFVSADHLGQHALLLYFNEGVG